MVSLEQLEKIAAMLNDTTTYELAEELAEKLNPTDIIEEMLPGRYLMIIHKRINSPKQYPSVYQYQAMEFFLDSSDIMSMTYFQEGDFVLFAYRVENL